MRKSSFSFYSSFLSAKMAKSMSKFFYNKVTMNKKCSCHLIYTRAWVNKDFVHSGSIGLI